MPCVEAVQTTVCKPMCDLDVTGLTCNLVFTVLLQFNVELRSLKYYCIDYIKLITDTVAYAFTMDDSTLIFIVIFIDFVIFIEN